MEAYKVKDKVVKKNVREDRRDLDGRESRKSTERSWKQEIKALQYCKAAGGESKEARLARWKEHFKKVLNREILESPPQEEQEETERWYFCLATLHTRSKSCFEGAQEWESP